MRIEKAECNYQVTECDLKFGEEITLDGELLIPISVIEDIKAEIEKYKADCLLADDSKECKRCDEITFQSILGIIDKYREGENE